ncbi:branched-chain amino acid ABC transporter permease [Truepera radiovictrix]|uniref:Inner-membrane translocator n=1 Tax=Truepera radiovictrix (strain DSM 17093 / CIP 108686 / LMG 22925 / RQ-24) TaxID=649638 RepID=D7CUW1_TRURR|nr:branched-chain amino acid ABC transporter permease [Truepera radiovictrix]ADI14102.1 inner-membrane translocator [Truepera radiovictrix DSM 17093]WMT57336.1 branched-chain amino acid ABC transporter permease [Truepera radiovictrix]
MSRAPSPAVRADVLATSALSGRKRLRDALLTLVGLALLALLIAFIDAEGTTRFKQACALFAIWGVAAISLNLINGTTGILSLGHHGFMLVGGYTTALLTLPEIRRQQIAESARSQMNDFTLGLSLNNGLRALGLEALTTPETLWIRFLIALFIGGLVAALFGLLVGIPSLRLRGDYLAIVTFGFGEIIRLLASTSLLGPFTNGSLGYTGVPAQIGRSLWWTFGFLALTVFVMTKFKTSSYGRALQGIREDEIAAEAMGVNLAYHKVLAFALSAFFAGVAGGLYTSWLSGARLDYFLFTLTFFFLVAISVGGTGSYTGVLLGTALVVFVRQYGDPLEQVYPLTTWFAAAGVLVLLAAAGALVLRSRRRLRPRVPPLVLVVGAVGLAALLFALVAPSFGLLQGSFQAFGMRAILLALLLLTIMIFRPEGIMGRAEFSWAWLLREHRDRPSDEERAQDAWLTNPELNPDRTAALRNLREPDPQAERRDDQKGAR